VILLDVNILIYASDPISRQQASALSWLEALFGSSGRIGFPWPTIWAFLRITTDRRMSTRPRTMASAIERVREWIQQPEVEIVQPGSRHFEILQRIVLECEVTGPLMSDAVLAALAIEHGATLASTDRDFSRFPSLKWVNPLDEG